MTRRQRFGWFLSRGFGPQGWGDGRIRWDYAWTEPELYQRGARELEQAGFDLLLIEDALSLGITPETLDLRVDRAYGGPKHDPLALVPYLHAATERITIIPTINPVAQAPYQAARHLASLQHLSRGRLGVNLVTDVGSAHHFGQERLSHDAAYDRAAEWLDIVKALWSSWGPGALVADRVSGRFADASKLRAVDHEGEHYRLRGALNAVPMDHAPVIASPGGSPRGLAFAGAHSDIQLAWAPLVPERFAAHRERVRAAAAEAGRNPDEIAVLFVFKPLVVSSSVEADRLVAASRDPDDGRLRAIAAAWSSDLEVDLTALDLDRPLEADDVGPHVSAGSIAALRGGREDLGAVPLRQILTERARLGRIGDGHAGTLGQPTVGTATEIADFIQLLGEEAENDGLLFSGDLHPATVHRTLDELVPELRRRGVLRTGPGPAIWAERVAGVPHRQHEEEAAR